MTDVSTRCSFVTFGTVWKCRHIYLNYVATLPCNLSLMACFLTLVFHKVVIVTGQATVSTQRDGVLLISLDVFSVVV